MKYHRIGGAIISLAAATAFLLLPDAVKDFSLIGKELVWEALAIVFAVGLALIFLPMPRRKGGTPPD